MSCNCQKSVSVIIQMNEGLEDLMPAKAHTTDACWDIFAAEDIILKPGDRYAVDNGFRMQLPVGYECQVRPRSGNAIKKGLTVLNTPGTIDCGYTGPVKTILFNASTEVLDIKKGDKIAQIAICKLPDVSLVAGNIDMNTERGEGGFGSTGTVK